MATGRKTKTVGVVDDDVFDELAAPHAKRIFRAAYRITRNRQDAEDAVQDALLQAFVRLEHFDGRSTFATWLTQIAINSSLMILRKRRHARAVSLDTHIFQTSDRIKAPGMCVSTI